MMMMMVTVVGQYQFRFANGAELDGEERSPAVSPVFPDPVVPAVPVVAADAVSVL
jgi:hypothetical protein